MSQAAPILLMVALALAGCGKQMKRPEPIGPKLSSIQHHIFTPRCSVDGCHSTSERKGSMTLVKGESFVQLVNAPASNWAANEAGKMRVTPRDIAMSFLMQKLTAPGPEEGDIMPHEGMKLTTIELDMIRQWIMSGALDN